jgi:lipopolysaccharide/colanic/teichoic acid biosynthesis glycosyltransferase
VLISIGVFWMLFSVMINYSSSTSPIIYKYANHGKNVPTLKYFKFNSIIARSST